MLKKWSICVLCVPLLLPISNAHAALDSKVTATADQPVDSFIIGYRLGSQKAKATSLGLPTVSPERHAMTATAAFGKQRGITMRHQRSLSMNAELLTTSKKLDRIDAERLMRKIAEDPEVAYVEPNILLNTAYEASDPHYPNQYGLRNGPGGINANIAWNFGYHGNGKIIAVIDTGVTPHPDLNVNIINGWDFITNAQNANDGDGRDNNATDPGNWTNVGTCYQNAPARDSDWHGTHVAGIISAVADNGIGIAGVAFNAKVLNVRALGRCGGNIVDIADAINWSTGGSVQGVPSVGVNRASVVNLSLGGLAACSQYMQQAIDAANSRSAIVVVAAGNDNVDAKSFTPANCSGTLVVGATDANGNRAFFSNYGAKVDVAAPGINIVSTVSSGLTVAAASEYRYKSGTSMSAPYIAGIAAMLQSRPNPDMNTHQFRQIAITFRKPAYVGAVPYPSTYGISNAEGIVGVQY
jgi:serine protease